MIRYIITALLVFIGTSANALGSVRDAVSRRARRRRAQPQAGELGIFMVLIFGAVALVVVSITLLFGMQVAGDFADNTNTGDPFTVTNETFTATGTGSFTYDVNRTPDTGNTVSLNDDETVHNRTSDTELTEGTDYEFYPSNGTVQILSNNDADAEFNITYSGSEHQYAEESASTTDSTGNAFELFGTSVLVIPAAAVLSVLIGGLIGAVTMAGGGQVPGQNGRTGGR